MKAKEKKDNSCYEWKDDLHFYIYDSYSCYDVVYVEKSLLGWKKYDNYLNWPKWSTYEENVKQIEVTCYEQTQTKEVTSGEVVLFTFDAVGKSNQIEATAYDAKGNAMYYLDERHIWIPVEE